MKLSKKSLIYLFMLIPLLEPAFISTTELDTIFSLLRRILFLFSVFLVLLCWNKSQNKKRYRILWCVYLYFLVLLLCTALSPSGNFLQWSYLALLDMSICNIVFLWIREDRDRCISYLLFYVEVLLAINLFTLICYPDGLFTTGVYPQYFLGYDNTHIRWIMPALTLSLLWSYTQEKKGLWKKNLGGIHPRTFILYCICLVQVVISKSATSIVGFSVFTILIVLLSKNNSDFFNRRRRLYSIKVAYLVAIVGTVMVSLIAFSYFGELLNKIETFFGKNLQINRIIVWRRVLESIMENLFTGVGVELATTTSMKLFNSLLQGVSAHNYLLNVLYQGGLIGFIAFINIYRTIGKKISYCSGSLPSAYFSIYYLAIAVMGLAEPQHSAVLLYAIWCLSYFVDEYVLDEYD